MKCDKCGYEYHKSLVGCLECGPAVEDFRTFIKEVLCKTETHPDVVAASLSRGELVSAIVEQGVDSWASFFIRQHQEATLDEYKVALSNDLLASARDPENSLGQKLVKAATENWVRTKRAKTIEEGIELQVAELMARMRSGWMQEFTDTVKLVARMHSQRVLAEFGANWAPDAKSKEVEPSS